MHTRQSSHPPRSNLSRLAKLLGAALCCSLALQTMRGDVVFTRSTGNGESWAPYSATFTPSQSGNYKLGFTITATTGGISYQGSVHDDHAIYLDGVQVTNSASATLFSSGFESPGVSSQQVYPNGTFGDWAFTNYSGVIPGSPSQWGPVGAQAGNQRGFVQAYNGTLSSIASASTFSLVAGQTYTVSFYQASRSGPIGNEGTLTYNATFDFVSPQPDTTPPVITAPVSITQEATGPSGAVVTFNATAMDAVSGPVSVTASPSSGSTFPLGTTSVGLAASDAAHNTATASFPVTVQDTTPPTISSVPANLTAEATSASGAAVTFANATATDLVDGNVSVTASPGSGSTFALGSNTVSLSATDAHHNTASASFTVKVQDTIAPALVVPGNVTAEATSANGANVSYAAATATDAVTASPAITYTKASGTTFPLGTTTVGVTAKDAANNSSGGSFTVTVRDTTAPALTVSGDVIAEATSASGAVVSYAAATATDAVTASPAISYSQASGTTFPLGVTTVSVTAKDAAGNVSGASFTVTVRDTTAPALIVPANKTIEATGPNGAIATFSASATDAVTASPTIAYSAASGGTFPIGTTTVNVTATDAAGNASNGSFTITVRDTTAPALTSVTPSSATLWPPNHQMVAIKVTAVASDLVGVTSLKIVNVASSEPDNGLGDGDTANDIVVTGDLTVNLRAERSGGGNGRTYTITVEARDFAGNASTKTCTVSVLKSQGGGK